MTTVHDETWQSFDAASALAQVGNWREAIPHYEALNAQPDLPLDLRAHLYNDLGVAYQSLGDLEKAVDFFGKSWDLYEDAKNRLGAAIALGNLATAHTQRRDWVKAVACFERSLVVFENEKIDNAAVAKLRVDMGDALAASGKPRAACEQYTLALARQEADGDKRAMALTLHSLGAALRARQRWEDGIAAFERSLMLFEELGDRKNLAATLNRLGELHYERHDYESAIAVYHRDLQLSEALRNQHAIAQTTNNLALAYVGQKEFEQAEAAFGRAIPLWEKCGDELGLATTLWGHAQLLFERDQNEKAIKEGQRAQAIYERLHSDQEAAVRKWLSTVRRGKRTGLRRYF